MKIHSYKASLIIASILSSSLSFAKPSFWSTDADALATCMNNVPACAQNTLTEFDKLIASLNSDTASTADLVDLEEVQTYLGVLINTAGVTDLETLYELSFALEHFSKVKSQYKSYQATALNTDAKDKKNSELDTLLDLTESEFKTTADQNGKIALEGVKDRILSVAKDVLSYSVQKQVQICKVEVTKTLAETGSNVANSKTILDAYLNSFVKNAGLMKHLIDINSRVVTNSAAEKKAATKANSDTFGAMKTEIQAAATVNPTSNYCETKAYKDLVFDAIKGTKSWYNTMHNLNGNTDLLTF